MYVVRDKKTKKVIHTNPAPLSQGLKGRDVYVKFDPNKMELGKTDGKLPEYFDINSKGEIVELSLKEQVSRGLIKLGPHQKIKNNQVVEKTLSELVKEGLLHLKPNQKIENNTVVDKSLAEQIKDGTIKLGQNQKIKDNKIVEKTLAEKVKEGIIILNEPFEQIVKNEIKSYSIEEVLKNKLIKTQKHYENVFKTLVNEIEKKISDKYSVGYELKVTKDFMDWMLEGKPGNDERESVYQKMQADIVKIKSEYKKFKGQLNKLKTTLN